MVVRLGSGSEVARKRMHGTLRTLRILAMLSSAVALAPSRLCLSPSRPRVSRRPILQQALALGLLLPSASSAAEKRPNLKEVVAQLDANTSKEERNAAGDKADHFPKIAFEGGQGQGKKVVFTVPHENLSPPDFSYIEFMWIKDERSGAILTARKFRPSDPDLVITAFGSSGQKLTAASKDNKFGIWQGTFVVP
mmetsp:Transcript_11213/g.22727  ORF Transcript_11213/g.22727 Transcript_11213/m.22727 type:complete len:194 (+) Transcript_11213:1-582(+)